MNRRYGRVPLPALGAVIFAAFLAVIGVPITSAQGQTLFVSRTQDALPLDAPFDPAWDRVRGAEITLSGQVVARPLALQPAFPSIRARALTDGTTLAVLLEWADPTRDEDVLAVEHFSDAVAVQLALGGGTSICMGQQAGGLNIWHWKADWAADLLARGDVDTAHPGMPVDPHVGSAVVPGASLSPDGFLSGQMAGNPRSSATHPSAVEDLNAVGFGTLTPQSAGGQNVHGASDYRDGVWRVVMSRPLVTADPNDASIREGDVATSIAFAVWDGSRGDRNGQKSVSAWLALSLPIPEVGFMDMWPFLLLLVITLVASGWVIWVGARQPTVDYGYGPPSVDGR